MRCRSAGEASPVSPRGSFLDAERHTMLLERCASFGLVEQIYTQILSYCALSQSAAGRATSWSQRQETNILFSDMKSSFQALADFLEDALLTVLRTSETKLETMEADHRSRVVELEFYKLLQDVLFEQLLEEGLIREMIHTKRFELVSEEHVEAMANQIITQVFRKFAVQLPSLGSKRSAGSQNVPSLPLLNMNNSSANQPEALDRLNMASRCSIDDIYTTPRTSRYADKPLTSRESHHRPQPREIRGGRAIQGMTSGAVTERHDAMGETSELVMRTSLARRRELMVSQGSVVSELEFTELTPEQQSNLSQKLSTLSFDVATLSFPAQCDVVKFCFHQAGVASWYELSALPLHSFIAEAAAMHRKNDVMHGRDGPSSWSGTVRWCHLLHWMLKAGASRFLTYFDVFAMLVAIIQVGTHMDIASTNWGKSSTTNQQVRSRLSISTLLAKVNSFLDMGGGIFTALTGCEVHAMKKKLATCFESSKSLYSPPTHPTDVELARIKSFILSMPAGSNVAHNRILQKRSSKSRPVLIQLLFHATSVGTLGMDVETIALPNLQLLLQHSQVPLFQRPRRALHHLVNVVSVLLDHIQSLGVASIGPLLANVNMLKMLQEKELKLATIKHKEQIIMHGALASKPQKRKARGANKGNAGPTSKVCALPPLASRHTFGSGRDHKA